MTQQHHESPKSAGKRKRGRPLLPRQVRVVPIRREQIDTRALGRALINLAHHQAAAQAQAEQPIDIAEGDAHGGV